MLWANAGSHSTRQVPTHAVAATAATAAKIRLISGRSTEPAAARNEFLCRLLNRAFDRDIMALLLNRAINRDIMSMNLQLNRLLGYCLALPSQHLVPQ